MRARARWDRLGGLGLRSRLITWAFVPTMVVLAAVAYIAFVSYERAAQEEAIGRERELAYLSAGRLNEEMVKFVDELVRLARTEASYPDNSIKQLVELRDAGQRLAAFDGGVVMLDQFGTVVGAQPPRPEILDQDWSDRIYFRRLLTGDNVAYSNTSADGPGGVPVVIVAVPISSPDGAILGAVAGMFRLGEPTNSAFYASLVRLRISRTNLLYLVDGYGQVLYHPDLERVGNSLLSDRAVQEVLAGQIAAWRERDRDGRDVVVSFAPVPGTSWGLISENAWATVIGRGQSYGRFLLFLLVLGTVLPAFGFALLARQRRAEALERARIEQEMRVARLIQQTLLPKTMPGLPGWQIGGHYQPAQAVGGDFYDFISLEDGRLGIVIGDVAGKGVPAALLMATTRSLLRSAAQRLRSPGAVLQHVNELLDQDIPPKMFVTCLYAVLDPATGQVRFANAGHNLPYRTRPGDGGVAELRATGMPLGLMPGMYYEEMEATLVPGECVLFYSDGLVEAHNVRRQMFGNPRLQSLMAQCAGDCPGLIELLLAELRAFAGKNWRQEDDVTLVTLKRDLDGAGPPDGQPQPASRTVTQFSLPSRLGNEREAVRRVVLALQDLHLSGAQVERIKTAVAEATMNAIEHGNRFQPDLAAEIAVVASGQEIVIRITDQGGGRPIPPPQMPDLEAKLAGRQPARGWGLFLIQNMVDDMRVLDDGQHHIVELVFGLKGVRHASQPV